MILAQSTPFTPNIANMWDAIRALGKPDKIFFYDTNLMCFLCSAADAGTASESFFSTMISHSHSIQYAKQDDLQVDDKYLFEVGGKKKWFLQIADLSDSYVVSDNIEIGYGNKIPLWLFGFSYWI